MLYKEMRHTPDVLSTLEFWHLGSIEDKVTMKQHLRDADKVIKNGLNLRGFTSVHMVNSTNGMHPEAI